MALPSILATGSHMDLLRKSEKEVLEIIESAVTLADLRWPKELHRLLKPLFTKQPDSVEDDGDKTTAVTDREAEKINPTKRRNIIRIQLRKDRDSSKDQDSSNLLKPDVKTTTAPKPAKETEQKPTKGRTVTGVRDLDSSSFHKPSTTTAIVVRKAVTAAPAPKKLEEAEKKEKEDEYEQKLENYKSKARTATAAPPKPAEETEENPTKGRKVTGVQTVRNQDSSNFHKSTTTAAGKARTATVARYSPPPKPAQETEEDRRKYRDSSNFHKPTTTVVRKAVTATPAPKRKLEEAEKKETKEEEYEKRLENSRRKFRDGYSQHTDSRKRSKITHYIPPPPESVHHDRLPNQKKSELLTTTRRR